MVRNMVPQACPSSPKPQTVWFPREAGGGPEPTLEEPKGPAPPPSRGSEGSGLQFAVTIPCGGRRPGWPLGALAGGDGDRVGAPRSEGSERPLRRTTQCCQDFLCWQGPLRRSCPTPAAFQRLPPNPQAPLGRAHLGERQLGLETSPKARTPTWTRVCGREDLSRLPFHLAPSGDRGGIKFQNTREVVGTMRVTRLGPDLGPVSHNGMVILFVCHRFPRGI